MKFDKTKPYIFFSYAHKDSSVGMQIIKGLQKAKFNLWYDEGIEVGTEYSDFIAEHIEGCKVFVCLMDENYVESRYCRDEIDFALNNSGIEILIIYKKELKDLKIPAGLKMRTSRYQAVFLNRFGSMDKFFDSLFKADILSPCNEELAKKAASEKVKFTVYEENGFEPTFEQKKNAERIIDTYALFGIKIEAFTGISQGPRVTRYEFRPDGGEKLSKIADLADDIALCLGATSLRLICPIPGKSAFGVEIPNADPKTVEFEEIFDSNEFKKSEDPLCVVLGKNIEGRNTIIELSRAPHLLIGGQTCSGKTAVITNMAVSLIKNSAPEAVKLLFIDPKNCEYSVFGGSKHLLCPVITDPTKGVEALKGLVDEIGNRLALFTQNGVRDITAYNRTSNTPVHRIVAFVDEFSLLADASNEFEMTACRIAQMGRAAGVHLVLATGEISNRVVSGMLKANIPSRIALSVKNAIESRIIIDTIGAHRLLLKGDMLYTSIVNPTPCRVQNAYIDPDKLPEILAFDKESVSTDTVPELTEALKIAEECGAVSPSLLERRLGVSYSKALKIIKKLDEAGHLLPSEGRGKPRRLRK